MIFLLNDAINLSYLSKTEMEKKTPKKRAVTDILNFEKMDLKEGPIQYGYFIDKQRLLKKLYVRQQNKSYHFLIK